MVGGAFLVLALLMWRKTHVTAAAVAGTLGALLLLGGLIVPGRLGLVYRGWMALAKAISKVTTPIFMSIIFFLVLTPAGFLVRLFGHRPLARRREAGTYWHSRPEGERRGAMDHQF
jgi:hypothetical protein